MHGLCDDGECWVLAQANLLAKAASLVPRVPVEAIAPNEVSSSVLPYSSNGNLMP